jgi:hypothetical protein
MRLHTIVGAIILLMPGVVARSVAEPSRDPVIRMFGPVTAGPSNTVSVYARIYQIGNGFVKSIRIFDKEELDAPVRVIVKNSGIPENFADQSIVVTQQSEERITYTVTSQSLNAELVNEILVECDGLVYFKCRVTPRPGRAFDCLKVDFPIKRSLAEMYWHSAVNERSYTYADFPKSGFLTEGTMNLRKADYCWLGNNRQGVEAFVGEDVATWSGWNTPSGMSVYKTATTAGVIINVEPTATYLASPYSFEFGLIATPVKDSAKNQKMRVGFGSAAVSQDYTDISQAKKEIGGLIDPKKTAMTLDFTMNDRVASTGYAPAFYDIFGIEGPGVSHCRAYYDKSAGSVTCEVVCDGKLIVKQTAKCTMRMGKWYKTTIRWTGNGASLLVGPARFGIPKNRLLDWAPGDYKLVMGGRGSITYRPILIDNKPLAWDYDSLDLPTTARFDDSDSSVTLTLEEPGNTSLDLSRYNGVTHFYAGQAWEGYHDYPLVTDPAKEANLRRDISAMHRIGARFFVYTSHFLSAWSPDFQAHYSQWCPPDVKPAYNGGPGTEVIYEVCSRAPGYEDWKWTNYETTLKRLDIDGVFLDGSGSPRFCDHGFPCHCALRNRAGEKVPRYNVFAIRERMKRIRRTFNNWKKDFVICAHAGGGGEWFTMSFADCCVTGEQLGMNFQALGSALPDGTLRSEFVGRQFGVECAVLADGWNCESAQALPFLTMLGTTDIRPYYPKSLPLAWRALDRFGLANARFVPFWENPLENVLPKGVKASVYVHGGKDALIMVTNYSGGKSPDIIMAIAPRRLIGKASLSQTDAVDYVRGLTKYPISGNTLNIGKLDPLEWTMIYVR